MKRALITIAIALVAAPAAAQAATYTVGPGRQFPTIADALAKATDGDTIHVVAGTYAEQPLTVDHAVRIEGEPGTVVTNAVADPSKPLFTVTVGGATIATLTAASTGGAVIVGQTGGLAIADALIVSAAGPGPGVQFAGSGASSLVRSSVAAIGSGADAVQLVSSTTGDRTLTIDSSILSGGAKATSLNVTSANSPTVLSNGNIVVRAVHATIAGAGTAVATTVTPFLLGTTPGTITAGVDRSILRGSVAAGVTVTKSDTSTADVFVNAAAKNFHLRADATGDIDQGGPAVPGESDRDVDGQPRVVGPASDLGADEFVNQPPVGRLATPAAVRTPGATTFDASASSDPEAAYGGGVRSYHFDFGDGTSADSATPVVSHAYQRPGTYSARVTVTDRQGLAGAPSAPVQARVVDGIAPTARIISPRNGAKVRLRGPIRFTGSALDDTGVAAVGLTLQRVGSRALTKIVVHVEQGIWSYRVPRRLRLRRGRYVLKAYAVDEAGNVSKPAGLRFTLK